MDVLSPQTGAVIGLVVEELTEIQIGAAPDPSAFTISSWIQTSGQQQRSPLAGKPRVWSDKRLLSLGCPPVMTYEAAPDRKRFAAVLYTDGTA